MTRVVVSQPMLFPWVGLFEQIRLADAYVHYDDVQFSKGSFTNRVKIKTAGGRKWLTLPLAGLRLGERIMDVALADDRDWRGSHHALLRQAYQNAPHRDEMLHLVESVYADRHARIAEIVIASVERCCQYFDLRPASGFLRSSRLGIEGRSWQRVLDIVRHVGGDAYVTGHGAKNYLDPEAFERQGVRVDYMDYEKRPYPQLYGEFTPYVSILDLIANRGVAGREVIGSGTVPWREFHVGA